MKLMIKADQEPRVILWKIQPFLFRGGRSYFLTLQMGLPHVQKFGEEADETDSLNQKLESLSFILRCSQIVSWASSRGVLVYAIYPGFSHSPSEV